MFFIDLKIGDLEQCKGGSKTGECLSRILQNVGFILQKEKKK
ncbi:MAG: hypothetical protein ACJAYJ_001069 [Saprospiraceae bacterium]